MSQRYAIFSAHYAPHTGGIEQFTECLAHELVREGHLVDVVTSQVAGLAPKEEPVEGLLVWRLPSRNLLDGRLPLARRNAGFRAMMAELAKVHHDGVLVNARYYDLSLEGVRFARKQGIPVVLLDHSSAPIGFGVPGLDSVVHLYERERTRRIRRYDPAFYGVSQASVEWLRSMGISARGVIHNAVDAEGFRASSSGRDYRTELGLAPGMAIVSFVGRLVAGKGADVLLEIARRMPQEACAFLVAGNGPQYQELANKAPSSYHLLGRLNKPDVSALLSQSDVFCFPSTYPEGLPTTLLEAAAWGVPIVSTNAGGAREIMPDDSYGVVLEEATPEGFRNAIEGLLSNRDQALEQGRAARANVEHEFSWRHTAHALLEAWSREH